MFVIPDSFTTPSSITIPLSRLARIVRSSRTLLKVPVLEIYTKGDDGATETIYQFGTVASVTEIIAAIEDQQRIHMKTE